MALKLKDKQKIVSKLETVLSTSMSIVSADATGVSVEKMTELRKKARSESVTLMVVKNTLARRALAGTEHAPLSATLQGPCLLGFSHKHPGAAAKLFQAFSKEHRELTVKHAVFTKQLFEGAQIKTLANLPTYEEALSQLLASLKEIAGGKLARTLAALQASRSEA